MTNEDFKKILSRQADKKSFFCEKSDQKCTNQNEVTKDRLSPYPDLSDCKNSPGEYVLSGMSSQGNRGIRFQANNVIIHTHRYINCT